jgi:hypothetical protein
MVFIPLKNSFYEQPLRTTLYFIQFLLKARTAVGLPDFVLQILADLKIGYGFMDLEIFLEHTLHHELTCINHRQNVTLASARTAIEEQIEDSVHMLRPAYQPDYIIDQ